MKRYSTSFFIKEMHIKIPKYDFTSTRVAILKKLKNNVGVNEDVDPQTLLVGM